MKRVVIFGAFDRYNYGDNLMPILFERFVSRFYPDFSNKYRLEFSALTNSDLSRYKAKKSVAIGELLANKGEDIHSIISIGGEILCASSSTLFLHMSHPKKLMTRVAFLKKNRLGMIADIYCRNFYKLPWEYPYIPKKFQTNTKIAFNTIGGGVSGRSISTYFYGVRKRLSEADYISVRDNRTKDSVQEHCAPDLFPDSAIVMSELITDKNLSEECGQEINELRNQEYLCFQAAPQKVNATASECAEVLKALAERYGLQVVLCPIGYASGHDDYEFLHKVNEEAEGAFRLLYELNVWEIMSVIRYSKLFLGTSLHGIITSLSFAVPHIGINKNIRKLDKFLDDWSIGASARCYSMSEVLDNVDLVLSIKPEDIEFNSKRLTQLGLENNHKLIKALGLDS